MALPFKVLLALVAACSLAVVPRIATAQHITVDGRFAPAQTLVGPTYSITANLGKQVGANLFHSFGQFGLATGESAAFSGPATVNNVIGRVTGGNPSSIDGRLQSNIAGANLYLINPSGIVFGPNATVNVTGSFHASTADYLKMSDGTKFQATNPDGSTLSAAPPAAFGFMTARPAAITVNGSRLGRVAGTLGVVAGPISITGATLSAPAGTIHVTSVAGTGEVPVDPRNTAALTVTSFAPVDIKASSKLNVSDPKNLGSGGSVFIRSGALTIDASEINGDNYGSGPGGVISLRGDNQITLTNGANVHAVAMGIGSGADVLLSTASSGVILADAATVLTDTMGRGTSGSISIIAGQLTLQNGMNMLAQTSASGSGGDVTVSAAGSLTIASGASLGTVAFADGNAGNVSVTVAGPLTVDMAVGFASSTLGGIGSLTQGAGNAGWVNVIAGAVYITNSGLISSETAGDGNNGNAGNVSVDAETLFMASNGEIAANTFAAGNAGSVTVAVAGQLTINGSGGNPRVGTGILSQADPGSSGAAGTVSIAAAKLIIQNNGEISASTFVPSDAGSISVGVSGQLTIDGSGGDPRFGTGIFSQANSQSGNATGAVSVTAGTLRIAEGGVISNTTFAAGNASRVTVSVSGQLTIEGAGGDPNARSTGIFSQADLGSTGAAGNVSVDAGTLVIGNGGQISSRTLGSGNGGTVSVDARNLMIVDDGKIATDTVGPGSGNAGSVSVSVADRFAIDGASQASFTGISSRSTQGSDGNAGDVKVGAESLLISNRGAISTEAEEQRSIASGGNITLRLRDLLYLLSSEISTSVKGVTGNGGDITIDPTQLVILNHSSIIAQAIEGHGGDITIAAGQLIPSSDSVISASSQRGLSGTVVTNGLVNVNGALIVLSTQLRGRTEVLREACAARGGSPTSTLVEAGRGGLAQDPEATLPALYIAGRELDPNARVTAEIQPPNTSHATLYLTMRCD